MCVYVMHPHLHVTNNDAGAVHTYLRTQICTLEFLQRTYVCTYVRTYMYSMYTVRT